MKMNESPLPYSAIALLRDPSWVPELAHTLVRDPDDAADAAQDAVLSALSTEGAQQPRTRAWFRRAVRNHAIDRRDQAARRVAREQEASRRRAERERGPELDATRREIADHVLSLGEPFRSVVLWRFWGDLPPRDIAARTGVPVATVKSRLARGLATLRDRLDAARGGDRSWRTALAPLAASARALTRKPTFTSSVASVGIGALLMLTVTAFSVSLMTSMEDPATEAAPPSSTDVALPSSQDAKDDPIVTTPLPAERTSVDPAPTAVPGGGLVRVLDAETGAPVRGAVVQWLTQDELNAGDLTLPSMRRTRRSGRRQVTNAQGETRIAWDGSGFGLLVATKGSRAGKWHLRYDQPPPITVHVRKTWDVPFEVVDRDGRPVPAIGVALYHQAADRSVPVEQLVTDAQGRGAFSSPSSYARTSYNRPLPAGAFAVGLRVPGLIGPLVPVSSDAPEPSKRIVVPECGGLRIRLRDARGAPFKAPGVAMVRFLRAGAAHWTSPRSLPFAGGRLTVPRVGFDQRIKVTVIPETASPPVTVEESGPTREAPRCDFEVTLERRFRVYTGRLLDPDDKPVTNRVVDAKYRVWKEPTPGASDGFSGARPDRISTDALGRFRTSFGTDAGPYAWRPGCREAITIQLEYGAATARLVRELPSGRSGDFDLGDLRLRLAPLRLQGHVKSPEGTPVPNAKVQLYAITDGPFPPTIPALSTRTDADGRYELRSESPLPPRFELEILHEGYSRPEGRVVCSPGVIRQDVEVQRNQFAHISGRLPARAPFAIRLRVADTTVPKPVGGTRFGLDRLVRARRDGTYDVIVSPRGLFRVRLRGEGKAWIDLRRAGSTVKTFGPYAFRPETHQRPPELDPIDTRALTNRRTLRILDQEGRPLPQATVQLGNGPPLRVNADGRVTVRSSVRGDRFVVRAPGHLPHETEPVTRDLDVRLRPHPAVTFRFEGDAPPADLQLAVHVYSIADRGGPTVSIEAGLTSAAIALRPGAYSLRYRLVHRRTGRAIPLISENLSVTPTTRFHRFRIPPVILEAAQRDLTRR